jgi:hypothetical protein
MTITQKNVLKHFAYALVGFLATAGIAAATDKSVLSFIENHGVPATLIPVISAAVVGFLVAVEKWSKARAAAKLAAK